MQQIHYIDFLNELATHISKSIEATRKVTITNQLFKEGKQCDIKGQYLKIIEEIMEAYNDYLNNAGTDELDEDMDIFMALMTLFHAKEYSQQEIKFSLGRTLKKFQDRGWMEKPV